MEEGDLESDAFQIQLDEDDWFDRGRATFIMTGVFHEGTNSQRCTKAQESAEAARERAAYI